MLWSKSPCLRSNLQCNTLMAKSTQLAWRRPAITAITLPTFQSRHFGPDSEMHPNMRATLATIRRRKMTSFFTSTLYKLVLVFKPHCVWHIWSPNFGGENFNATRLAFSLKRTVLPCKLYSHPHLKINFWNWNAQLMLLNAEVSVF